MTNARACAALLPALVLAGCFASDDGLVDDPGFDLWCDDMLCSWEVETGSVERVPTWHEKDYGVELSATPTTISQRIEVGTPCIGLRIVAHIERSAEVEIGLDLFADDSEEHSERIAELDWEAREIPVELPNVTFPTQVLIRLRKSGEGDAVFGELSVEPRHSCPNAAVRLGSSP